MQPNNTNGILTVLSVSPDNDDHAYLESAFSSWNCRFLTANNLFGARALMLQRPDTSVVVCEKDLNPGTWDDILRHARSMQHPPSLIVTSRMADDRLWSEVLNLGGWDVLAKPFDGNEVLRSVRSACQQWHGKHGIASQQKALRAAS